MSRESKNRILYLAVCGNPAGKELLAVFRFIELAPATLCEPGRNIHKNGDPESLATRKFMESVVDRHSDEILKDRAWKCVSCDKPAEEMLHSAVSFLSQNTRNKSTWPDFVPKIIDRVFPFCTIGGECSRNAEKLALATAKESINSENAEVDVSKSCENCGKGPEVKLCSGCKISA